jgi:uridylate kinase
MQQNQTQIIKLTGKILNQDVYPIVSAIAKVPKGVIVIGGGDIARKYIEMLISHESNQGFADMLGIEISKVNARLLAYLALSLRQDVCTYVPSSLQEIRDALTKYSLVFVGGFQPGQSTDTVAALIAEYLGAKYILNAANVDAVYTDDPRKNKEAKRLEKISIQELINLLEKEGVSSAAGHYELVDIWALKIMERSKISMRIIQATPEIIERALNGENVGTIIYP